MGTFEPASSALAESSTALGATLLTVTLVKPVVVPPPSWGPFSPRPAVGNRADVRRVVPGVHCQDEGITGCGRSVAYCHSDRGRPGAVGGRGDGDGPVRSRAAEGDVRVRHKRGVGGGAA